MSDSQKLKTGSASYPFSTVSNFSDIWQQSYEGIKKILLNTMNMIFLVFAVIVTSMIRLAWHYWLKLNITFDRSMIGQLMNSNHFSNITIRHVFDLMFTNKDAIIFEQVEKVSADCILTIYYKIQKSVVKVYYIFLLFMKHFLVWIDGIVNVKHINSLYQNKQFQNLNPLFLKWYSHKRILLGVKIG